MDTEIIVKRPLQPRTVTIPGESAAPENSMLMRKHTLPGASLEAKTETVLRELLKNEVVREGLGIVQKDLPEGLYYHNAAHTYDVLHDAVMLALQDKRTPEEIELIAIAAAFHDTGFARNAIRNGEINEDAGARTAWSAMAKAGYPRPKMAIVERIILDTQLKITPAGTFGQVCNSDLSGYVLDADLGNFGKREFFDKMINVHSEFCGKRIGSLEEEENPDGVKFLKNTSSLLSNHRWQTAAARTLWESFKQENIDLLNTMIEIFSRRLAVN